MKRVIGLGAAAILAAACSEQAGSPGANPADIGSSAAPQAAVADGTLAAGGSQADSVPGAGPLDGIWRCKMNGDIPLGTLDFKGERYTFKTTNTAWEPNPNAADGSGEVRFEETFVLPQSGPLKDSFEVTGAYGDGSFINFNTDQGVLFGCRRP